LKNPDNAIWIGICKGQVVSIMEISKKKSNDAQILSDEATISVGETYTIEEFRGDGITKAILHKVIEEYSNKGYKRCAVVFESQNINGSDFWLRYFEPVCYSLVRKIDDRITWANKKRWI
jgi:GNAT superfamily N-acetyltransferase